MIEEAFETNGDGGETNTFGSREGTLRFGVTSRLFFHLVDRILLLYYSFLCKCAMVCGPVRLIFVIFRIFENVGLFAMNQGSFHENGK